MTSSWTRAGVVGAIAATAIVAVDLFGAPGRAQQDVAVPIVFPGSDSGVAISDDGNIVVFRAEEESGATSIVVHNRVTATTSAVTSDLRDGELGAELGEPAVSGDGCVIAFPVGERPGAPAPAPAAAGELRMVDRCLDPNGLTVIDPLPIGDAIALTAPALSRDASVLVVSDGQDVRRYTRSGPTRYEPAGKFDGPAASSDAVRIAKGLDISSDGKVIVFASGTDPGDRSTLAVQAWVDGTVSTVETNGWSASVSGDGRIIVYQNSSGVSLRDRTTPATPPVIVEPDGDRPRISGDGHHIVFEFDDAVRVTSWIGSGSALFDVTSTRTVVGLAVSTSAGPAIDQFGATVVSDGAESTAVAASAERADFSAELFDLGKGLVGSVLSTTATFTNDGPASVGVEDVTVAAPFVIASNECVGSIRPQSTCAIKVTMTVTRSEDVFGVVTINKVGTEAADTTEIKAEGQEPPATVPTTSPGTTSGGTTTGGTTTGGTTTGGTTTSTTGGRPTTTTTGGRSTTTTTGGRPTTTTTPPAAALSFSPAAVEFAPTVVDAGRQSGTIEVVNPSTRNVAVAGARLEPTDQFSITGDACSGRTVPAGGRCLIELEFAPTAAGSQVGQLVVQAEGGRALVATVSGTGAPPPTLVVSPDVATVGQVVTISGGGFPAGVTLRLSWGQDVVPMTVVVDGSGGFNLPVIVRPHTPSGPTVVVVDAQPDTFDTVTATMVVTTTSDRAGAPGVLTGVGPNVAR